jgi:NIPSNAP protein
VIVDHRTYTFRPGGAARWVAKYEKEGFPLQQKYLGHFIGLYTTEIGDLHQTVMMWGYDSLQDRDDRRGAMAADPAWQKYMEEVFAMDALVAQEIKILRPAPGSPSWR